MGYARSNAYRVADLLVHLSTCFNAGLAVTAGLTSTNAKAKQQKGLRHAYFQGKQHLQLYLLPAVSGMLS